MLIRFLIFSFILCTNLLQGQSVGINDTGNQPDDTAVLDVQSTSKGMLIPRMNSTQRTGINSPAEGLLVFDTDTKSFWFNAGGWIELISGKIDELSDADGETKIQVEKTNNDNNIRFDVGDVEAMILKENGDLDVFGNNPDDPGFMTLKNSDGSQFLRFFSGRSGDPSPFLNWQLGSPLRFVGSNSDFSGFHEYMRIEDGKLGIGTNYPSALLHINEGPVLFSGTLDPTYTGPLPSSGAGTRLMWIPERGAFRAGSVDGDQWDLNKLGDRSTVSGGDSNTAEGGFTFIGGGLNNHAFGTYSSILGGGAHNAVGYGSTVVGGASNFAQGEFSFAAGLDNKAHSYGEVVLGFYSTYYNEARQGSFDSRDRLFVIGNGNSTLRSNALTILKTGNMGLGIDDPTYAKLVVNGTGTTETITAYQYGFTGINPYFINQDIGLSAVFSHDILAAGFLAISDQRIKNIKGVSDSSEDLDILNKIEITDYCLKDSLSQGNKFFKKVIAQQVKEVFPQAVTDNMTDVIPDIYQMADCKNGWIQLTTDLNPGDRVRLIMHNKSNTYEVAETKEGAFFINDLHPSIDQVFVFGREVDDFHSVDYEALSMLNISATQAQQRIIESQAKEIDQLESQLESLLAKVQKIETILGQTSLKID